MKKRFFTLIGIALVLFSLRALVIDEQWNASTLRHDSFIELLSSRDARVCQFDCVHYVEIAENRVENDPRTAAFFPAWTSLIRWARVLAPHVHTEVLAVWLSNLFLLAAVFVALLLGEELRLKTPLCGEYFLPLAILVFPFGVSSSFGYGEPLFLILFLSALLSAQRKSFFWSALWMGFLGLTRVQGVIVAGAFSGLLLWNDFPRISPWACPWVSRRTVLLAVIPFLPFLAYLFWQWREFGDALAFVHAQQHWGRAFSPLRALLDQAPRPKMFPVMIWICLVGSFFAFKRKDFFWALLALSTLGLTEVPLFSGGLMSYARYLSVNVWLFVFLAKFLTDKVTSKVLMLGELALFVWALSGFASETTGFLIQRICP